MDVISFFSLEQLCHWLPSYDLLVHKLALLMC